MDKDKLLVKLGELLAMSMESDIAYDKVDSDKFTAEIDGKKFTVTVKDA